ncbi:HD domain-containing phosphohydrolase [Promicromonospora panici]|uniref:HD domain-containing phosphohydrolase n=1 Tax=Promicromonospora panici TaxID=2219658 RepID=UPI0013ECD748|nr:HD domain-containing phosphohydrolase [Promicromonospora panici]
MSDRSPQDESVRDDEVRTAEVVAALSLATDLGTGVPLEHGLHSALIATRLGDILGVDRGTQAQAYYTSLLFYVGCTASAKTASEVFAVDNALTKYGVPFRFGSPAQMMAGMSRAVAPPGQPLMVRALQLARGMPALAREFGDIVVTDCDVAQMLTVRLGLPSAVSALFAHASDRWDGRGWPAHTKGEAIPLPMRIAHVARDAAFQRMLGGDEFAARVVHGRAGGAFDPDVAEPFAEHAAEILAFDPRDSAWPETLAAEPPPNLMLKGEAIDQALGAIGDFADLVSPYFVGHSADVAGLAADAGRRCGLDAAQTLDLRRGALVHDVGRVAVPVRIWQDRGPLSPDDWERVRLHAYYTERVLSRSPFLAALAPIAAFHHERLDGSGYHRGTKAAALATPARVLAAADAYHTMTEPRPHRDTLSPARAAGKLGEEVRAGRLDADAVVAVLAAAGQRVPRVRRPAGLTDRESEVVVLLARGLQTKQVARALGISAKTADSHIQNAYRKMGVSTRAGAALFAMQHGLAVWGELPIERAGDRS